MFDFPFEELQIQFGMQTHFDNMFDYFQNYICT